jgi:hypothetical protein
MRRAEIVLSFIFVGACTGVADAPDPRVPVDAPAPQAQAAAPTPAAAEPAAVAPVVPAATPATPPRLAVAFEGRCNDLGTSVIDDQVLVHHVSRRDRVGDYDLHLTLVRLDAQGSPAETLPEPPPYTARDNVSLSGVDRLYGRWPDQLYAAISVGTRGDWDTGFIRFDGKVWSGVHPFGPDDRVTGVVPWHQRSIVAVACGGECNTMKLPVIRGAPKGPSVDKLRAALAGCEEHTLVEVAAIESGDLVAVGRCDGSGDAGLVAARWKPDDLVGEVKRLAAPGFELTRTRIAHDGRQDFWIAVAGGAREVLVHSAPGRWDEVEGPPGKGFADLAVDPRGAAWFLRPDGLWRRDGEKWVAEAVGIKSMFDLLGVEQDTPWVRGDAVARGSAGGAWQRVEVPPSLFFPDRRLEVTDAEVDRAGDIWLDAQFTVIRKDKVAVGRYYRSVVTSRPVVRPLRCGEVLLDPLPAAFAPWPPGFDASCQRPLVLLQGQDKWKPGNTYPSYGKALRHASDVGAPRFVELEIGGKLMLGAIVDGETSAKALITRARKAQRWQFPETVCGDPAALARADVKIVRELAADLAAGKLSETQLAAGQ